MGVYPNGAKEAGVKTAALSEDGVYRYLLVRRWSRATPPLPFIMLNPSTADALNDDPTIRRCVAFAVAMNYGGIEVYNLFAYRTPSPTELMRARAEGVDIIGGARNDNWLLNVLLLAQRHVVPIIAGWGNAMHPKVLKERVDWLLAQPGSEALHSLGVTKAGHPRHPLYLPASARPQYWPPEREAEADA